MNPDIQQINIKMKIMLGNPNMSDSELDAKLFKQIQDEIDKESKTSGTGTLREIFEAESSKENRTDSKSKNYICNGNEIVML